MYVEKKRMMESACMTLQFLGLKPHDTTLLCMPLDYIAGKMVVVRSLVGNLNLKDVGAVGHPMADEAAGDCYVDFAAMVPLQVYNSLGVEKERQRLMNIRHLLIGGGAVDDGLAAQLRDFPHAVWSTYGMTETLSHIALRRLSGEEASEWYTPFNSVKVSLSDEGCLVIDAPLVCAERLVTNDMAELLPDGRFRILGRKDNVICSGGIKIQAEEVERKLQSHLSAPYLISKRKDAKFGEVVVLLTEGDTAEARRVCEQVLPKYHQPRVYVHVDRIPLTETGKPARRQAEQLAMKG